MARLFGGVASVSPHQYAFLEHFVPHVPGAGPEGAGEELNQPIFEKLNTAFEMAQASMTAEKYIEVIDI